MARNRPKWLVKLPPVRVGEMIDGEPAGRALDRWKRQFVAAVKAVDRIPDLATCSRISTLLRLLLAVSRADRTLAECQLTAGEQLQWQDRQAGWLERVDKLMVGLDIEPGRAPEQAKQLPTWPLKPA